MIIFILVVLGLCFGSFVNALVWRVHEQAILAKYKSNKKYATQLSIIKGRSICPTCKHELAAVDLIPVISWLSLNRKCRYCRKPISVQYPTVELLMALLFVASYIWWPVNFVIGVQTVLFGLWLIFLVGLLALLIYDYRWQLLPNRMIYPLSVLGLLIAAIKIAEAHSPLMALFNTIAAVAIGGGIFYILYQVSSGKWIGGGDVRLGWLLGLIVGTPGRSLLMIFLAALLGSLISLPLIVFKRLKPSSTVPFGPFLIISVIVVQLFGHNILGWYQHDFLNFSG